MKFMKKTAIASVIVACTAINLAVIQNANAATLRVANQGDALSLDPHSLNESLQLSVVRACNLSFCLVYFFHKGSD